VKVNDAVIGVVLVLFALAMLWHTRTFPDMPGQDFGPKLFPRVIGAGFLITGAILIAGGLAARRRAEPWFSPAAWLRSPPQLVNFAAVLGALVLYILVSTPLGFIPTAFLLLAALLVLFRGGRPLSSAVIALAVTLVVNFVFTQWLLVPLPLGVMQSILY